MKSNAREFLKKEEKILLVQMGEGGQEGECPAARREGEDILNFPSRFKIHPTLLL